MSPERAIAGTRVRGRENHRRESLRGLAGKVVGRYGRSAHVAVDVRFSDGRCLLFWPRDLEEVASAQPLRRRWRSLLKGASDRRTLTISSRTSNAFYSLECVEKLFGK